MLMIMRDAVILQMDVACVSNLELLNDVLTQFPLCRKTLVKH